MSHPLYDVTHFETINPYVLRVIFNDNSEQIINFEPVLYGELFRPLRNIDFFNQVCLDDETHTLVWPNGADFDPWMLHEWDRLAERLEMQARTWETVPEYA